jgi:hypothetical protein
MLRTGRPVGERRPLASNPQVPDAGVSIVSLAQAPDDGCEPGYYVLASPPEAELPTRLPSPSSSAATSNRTDSRVGDGGAGRLEIVHERQRGTGHGRKGSDHDEGPAQEPVQPLLQVLRSCGLSYGG